MTEYYHIVPWFSSEEWHEVYREIFHSTNSNTLNYEKALKTLLIWKARCPSLPSGIESTLGLLQVRVEDKLGDNIPNDQFIRLAYATAIMRFVNHMLDNETAKGTSLYQAAKAVYLPDWIIDLRHDAAHNNNLPSLSLLRDAAIISLNWLEANYWDKHRMIIQDYVSGQTATEDSGYNKLCTLMHLCLSVSICSHPKCHITKMSDIPNSTMVESIVNDVRELFGDCIDLSNLKTVSIKSFINMINVQSYKLLKGKDASVWINKALLGDESSFLSMELLYFFCGKNFKMKGKLHRSYVQCFEMLLTFLHTHDFLSEFTLDLIKITQVETNDKRKTTLAALWVAEILNALIKSKCFLQKIKKTNQEDIKYKKKNDLILLYNHWFPNEKDNGLTLDLCKPVPDDLTNLNIVKPILSTYNPYLAHFAKYLLELVDPKLPNVVIERVLKLTQLISSPEKFPIDITTRIYTEDDLKSEQEIINLTGEEIINLELEESTKDIDPQNSSVFVNDVWKVASKAHNWAACPIGTLPWHMNMEVDET